MATKEEGESSTFEGFPLGFVARAAVASVFLGAYASWITADLLPRAMTFVFVTVGVGGMLYRQWTEAGDESGSAGVGLAYAGYVFAGLLLLTPLMMILPDVVYADAYGGSVVGVFLMTMNIVYFVFFGVLAAVVAYLSRRSS